MNFWETVERGEYVMIALAVIFIVIICIWWARSARLGKQRKGYATLMQRVRDHVVEGDIENARQLCDITTSPAANVLYAGLGRIGTPMTEVRAAMWDTAEIEKDKMTAGTRWLRALSVISPLLGLGGTLVGVIDRLRDLGLAGFSTDISAVCGAIAPTIVTTVAGLGVGIFSLIALTALESRIDSSKSKLDEVSIEFTNLLNEPS